MNQATVNSTPVHSFGDPHAYVGQHVYDPMELSHMVVTGVRSDGFLCRDVNNGDKVFFSFDVVSEYQLLGCIDGSYDVRVKVLKRVYEAGWRDGSRNALSRIDRFDNFLNDNIDLLDSNQLDELLPF